MVERPIVLFGAGATAACEGPLTWEILPRAFEMQSELYREDYFPTLETFLVENFHLPRDPADRTPDHYPALPLLISLLDTAIDHQHSFNRDWPADRLVAVRAALEYVIFALLEHSLRHIPKNPYHTFLGKLDEAIEGQPQVISLNYDIIADNTLMQVGERSGAEGFPDYGCDVATPQYRERPKFGSLHKLHGSMNWLYCPACNRLDVGISESGRRMAKQLEMLYHEVQAGAGSLEDRYTCHGSPCLDCGTFVRPVMITPTHMKDYRNPHVARVWYQADRAMRRADRAYLVGYSLPEDDVDVIYLIKRGLAHLAPDRITVVDHDPQGRAAREHPTGSRYCTLFGDGIDWEPGGFEAFADGFVLA